MESRTLRLLEFHRVLDFLSSFAVSAPGKKSCLHLSPATDLLTVEQRTEILRLVIAMTRDQAFVLGPFPALDDLWAIVARETEVLTNDNLWGVKQVLLQAKQLRTEILTLDEDRYSLLRAGFPSAGWPEAAWSGLNRCLDVDGRLKDESSPKLFALRQELRHLHGQCTKKVTDFLEIGKIGEYLQDDFLTISSDRFVLAVKANFKGRIKGIVHDYSQTGETCYVEPLFLIDLNNRLRDLKQEEREAEFEVLRFLTGLVRQDKGLIEEAYLWLIAMDVDFAKAKFASVLDAVPVSMRPGASLSLRRVRHPLLIIGKQSVQPLDIELNQNEQGLIISGGNAGGKTVCLKTLGIAALMALTGLPVPADEGSVLPLWSDVFVFIGDEQSLDDHVSTFTAQITHLARVWPQIHSNALVILDEFGAGTDPSQGAALAQAVIDELLAKGGWVAAATHFPALKAYALSAPGIRAASVLFDPTTKRPMYSLAYDQVGTSLALDVAREHGLPREILVRAERYLLLDGQDTSQVLERLNELAATREQEVMNLRRDRREAGEKLTQERERLQRERTKILSELKSKSQEIVREWRAGRTSRKQALQELAQARIAVSATPLTLAESIPSLTLESLETGLMVIYSPWARQARVMEKDMKKSQVKLDFQGVGIWADIQDIVPAKEQGQRLAKSGHVVRSEPVASMHLDLRGKRADEAVSSLSKYIDQAILSGLKVLEIIHGKGTGALRKEIHASLRGNPAVQSFCAAPPDRGGDGVTLIELH